MTTKEVGEFKPMRSPIRWVGGKSRLRKFIVPLIPAHHCYVEAFCGAAWVLFGKPPSTSKVEILNDIDQELVNFFHIVKHRPQDLIDSFDWTLVARAEFERLVNLDPSTLNEIDRAHRFFYLIMAGWGGEFNYPRFQTSITDGGHGNRLFGAIKHLEQRIRPVHDRLSTVIIENKDWLDIIDRYDDAKTFMYLDPPYPGNGVNYKHNMRSWVDHKALAERLAVGKFKWMVSSYDSPEVRTLFSGNHITSIEAFSGMDTQKKGGKRKKNLEVLITNYDPHE